MKIKWGALAVDGRGKIGGHVASKNRGGAYLRTKVTPVNPQTAFQAGVRAIFGALAQAWRSLTEAQRDSFNGAVSNFTKTDIFGDIKTPSGENLYIKLNSNLAEIGVAGISTAPLPVAVPSVNEVTPAIDISDAEMVVTTGSGNVPAGSKLVIKATAPVSAGKYFLKGKYRKVAVINAGDSVNPDIWASYVARFGAPSAGPKVGFECYYISSVTGQKGVANSNEAIALA